MELIRTFFRKTHYFWIVSRVILLLLFLFVLVDQKIETGVGFAIITTVVVLFVISIISLIIFGLTKKEAPKLLKLFAGGFSLFFGAVLLYLLLFTFNVEYVYLAFCIPLWLLLHGTWEITNKIKKENR
jgi:hypothetical protein